MPRRTGPGRGRRTDPPPGSRRAVVATPVRARAARSRDPQGPHVPHDQVQRGRLGDDRLDAGRRRVRLTAGLGEADAPDHSQHDRDPDVPEVTHQNSLRSHARRSGRTSSSSARTPGRSRCRTRRPERRAPVRPHRRGALEQRRVLRSVLRRLVVREWLYCDAGTAAAGTACRRWVGRSRPVGRSLVAHVIPLVVFGRATYPSSQPEPSALTGSVRLPARVLRLEHLAASFASRAERARHGHLEPGPTRRGRSTAAGPESRKAWLSGCEPPTAANPSCCARRRPRSSRSGTVRHECQRDVDGLVGPHAVQGHVDTGGCEVTDARLQAVAVRDPLAAEAADGLGRSARRRCR